ncbi:hypothetical protein Sjap_023837 [Stephania japonica]|uniref:Uncharacterized protein n=1 Tax=Stephania japonica TaxID=461633 RepID=A0AAP0HPL2_9MAGN
MSSIGFAVMAKEDYFCKGEDEPWRVLEFYSGIGGMRYSIMKAGVSATMVEAFDINDKANDVYEHNFGHRPFQNMRTQATMKTNALSSDAARYHTLSVNDVCFADL